MRAASCSGLAGLACAPGWLQPGPALTEWLLVSHPACCLQTASFLRELLGPRAMSPRPSGYVPLLSAIARSPWALAGLRALQGCPEPSFSSPSWRVLTEWLLLDHTLMQCYYKKQTLESHLLQGSGVIDQDTLIFHRDP